jgi:hypothetical protein
MSEAAAFFTGAGSVFGVSIFGAGGILGDKGGVAGAMGALGVSLEGRGALKRDKKLAFLLSSVKFTGFTGAANGGSTGDASTVLRGAGSAFGVSEGVITGADATGFSRAGAVLNNWSNGTGEFGEFEGVAGETGEVGVRHWL